MDDSQGLLALTGTMDDQTGDRNGIEKCYGLARSDKCSLHNHLVKRLEIMQPKSIKALLEPFYGYL